MVMSGPCYCLDGTVTRVKLFNQVDASAPFPLSFMEASCGFFRPWFSLFGLQHGLISEPSA